jgi:tRNA threonylcarbamoyladenosine biosynthesis protein TsaB
MIIALRTDKPEAELYLLNDDGIIKADTWHAHRELSNTLLKRIDTLLLSAEVKKEDIDGIVVYQGPGSFTGLRIGISVANTLAYAWSIPVAGGVGEHWREEAILSFRKQKSQQIIVPQYGQEANITAPRK